MNLIQLNGEDQYKIEQKLIDWIMKVIEIYENMLISVSYDKTMKIWKINNCSNQFQLLFFKIQLHFVIFYKLIKMILFLYQKVMNV